MRLASFTQLALAGFAPVNNLFHLWTEVIFLALCKHLYFFGTMSKRKISSYFQRETDKIIDEAEEKTENEFHEENDARLPNLKPRNFQTKWLNEHKWLRYENNTMFCHFCRLANKKNPFGGERAAPILKAQL